MIKVTDLHKSFGPKRVLDGVSFDLPKGESLVLIGGSGTGKSVLLKCILGLETADHGTIHLDGTPVTSAADRQPFLTKFGMLFQGAALFDSLPVWQNVSFRLLRDRAGLSKADAKEIAVEKLKRVGLNAQTADLYPSELSGGMQKRVGLARAIACDPEVIFFDEPTTGLDPIMSGVINDLIREIVTDMGASALTITHDMRTVETVADHVAMLHDGKLRWQGSIKKMKTAKDPYLTQFVNGHAEGPIDPVR